MTKNKRAPKETEILFRVDFETPPLESVGGVWFAESLNVLAFDGESAIDKTRAYVERERNEKFRLLGVALVARVDI